MLRDVEEINIKTEALKEKTNYHSLWNYLQNIK